MECVDAFQKQGRPPMALQGSNGRTLYHQSLFAPRGLGGSAGSYLRRGKAITVARSYRGRKAPEPTKPQQKAFELRDISLPRPEDINGGQAWKGVLAGVVVGTVLSLGVSAFKATFVAGVIAAGVSLIPKLSLDSFEEEGPELPGVAIATAAGEGQNSLQGDKELNPRTTATVAAAALGAGVLVALFAAKSLGLVLAGTVGFVAVKKDDDYDVQASAVEGRDFLRTRGGKAPGVAASLFILQAKNALSTLSNAFTSQTELTGATQGSADPKQAPLSTTEVAGKPWNAAPALTGQMGQSTGLLEDSLKARQAEKEGLSQHYPTLEATRSSPADADQPQGESLLAEALKARRKEQEKAVQQAPKFEPAAVKSGSPADAGQPHNENLLAEALKARQKQQEKGLQQIPKSKPAAVKSGSPVDADQPQGESLLAEALKAQQKEQEKAVQQTPKFEPAADKSSSPADAGQPENENLLAEALKARQAEAGKTVSNKQVTSNGSMPNEANKPRLKRGNLLEESLRLRQEQLWQRKPARPKQVAAIKDEPTAVDSSKDENLLAESLKARKAALQSSAETGATDRKGSLQGATPPDKEASNNESLLDEALRLRQQSTPARASRSTSFSGASKSPLESIKGQNPGVEAGDLARGSPNFKPAPQEPLLKNSSSSQQDKQPPGTPLESLKGKSEGANTSGLASGKADFKPAKQEPVLNAEKTVKEATGSPLEQMKGKGKHPEQSLLAGGPVVSPGSKEGLLSQDTAGNGTETATTPLQSLKGSSSAPSASGRSPAPTLGSTPSRKEAGPQQASVLQLQQSGGLGKVLQLLSISSRALGAAAAAPFQSSKPATEQSMPRLQPAVMKPASPLRPQKLVASTPPAARPSPPRPAAPSLTKGLAAAGSSTVAGFVGRSRLAEPSSMAPNRVTPPETAKAASALAGGGPPKQKRTAVERWLVVAGIGIVAGLSGLIWLLVNGAALTELLPKGILAAVFMCMLAVVLLVSMQPKGVGTPSTA